MIRCEDRKIEIDGEDDLIKAQFVGIASCIKEKFGVKEYRKILYYAEMSEEEMREENEKIKQKEEVYRIVLSTLASRLRSEIAKVPEEIEERKE